MEKLLTSHQVAKLLNVWPETLRRWEKEGKLKPLRTPGGHRRYKESQIKKLLGEDQGINSTSKNASSMPEYPQLNKPMPVICNAKKSGLQLMP